MKIEHKELPEDEVWWCKVHRRRATHFCEKKDEGYYERTPCCDPKAAGIMLPCECVQMRKKWRE